VKLFGPPLFAFAIAASAATAHPVFLSPGEVDPRIVLPAPPAEGSPAAQQESAELEAIQASRTPDALARAQRDDVTENASIFRPAIGDGFDLANLPATARLMADVRNEEKDEATAAKNFFLRDRPWIVDSALQSCSKKDAPQSAYPSGHATMGYAMGVVLAFLIPGKAQAILARANEYSENRLVCGMHRRRDIVAGEALGTAVAIALLHHAEFKVEYDAAESELKAAKLVP
jgi:acid phosphatase (class A)